VFNSAWAAVLHTLKLQQLSNEDAAALLDSMSRAIAGLASLYKQQQQQQQQQQRLQDLCVELPVQLFSDTLHLRWAAVMRCRRDGRQLLQSVTVATWLKATMLVVACIIMHKPL
jgi:hypothetical protein